jgi:hypothetical protein
LPDDHVPDEQRVANNPEYRRAGLPVSSATIESMIKEINYSVKGTEKLWERPSCAENILRVRAAALDDDCLSCWMLPTRLLPIRPLHLASYRSMHAVLCTRVDKLLFYCLLELNRSRCLGEFRHF